MELERIRAIFERDEAKEICRRYDVQRLGVFGSTARNEATEASDIDLLVSFARAKGFVDFITLEEKLAQLLAREVDLASEKGLHPSMREEALRELQIVYVS
jgi:predicted nucleotidyltransferase